MTHILMTRMLMALHEVFLTRTLRIFHFLPFQQHAVSFPSLFYSKTTNLAHAATHAIINFRKKCVNLLGTKSSLGSV